jgi:hypothetical protein
LFVSSQEIDFSIACVQREPFVALHFAGNNHRFTVFRPEVTAERSSFPAVSSVARLLHRLLHRLLLVWQAVLVSTIAQQSLRKARLASSSQDISWFITQFMRTMITAAMFAVQEASHLLSYASLNENFAFYSLILSMRAMRCGFADSNAGRWCRANHSRDAFSLCALPVVRRMLWFFTEMDERLVNLICAIVVIAILIAPIVRHFP